MKTFMRYNKMEIYLGYLRTNHPVSSDVYSSHIHNNYELLFFYEGDADYIINGAVYHLQKGDLMLVRPAVFHNIRILSSRPYERMVFLFDETAVRKNLVPVLRSMENCYRIDPNSPLRRLLDYARDCSSIFSQDELLHLAKSVLNEALTHIKYVGKQETKEKEHVDSNLEKILLYIDEHPTEVLNIAHLSKLFNLSESWIAHAFKKNLGISPANYINRKKIFYAQSLIDMGMSPVQAAEACSYINYTTFYRQYKKYLGSGPAEHKKNTPHEQINT